MSDPNYGAHPNGSGVPSGGAPGHPGVPQERRRIPMWTYREGYSFPAVLYSIQNWQLPRPQRVLPLTVSALVGFVIAFRLVTPVFGTFPGWAAFAVILWFGPRLVEELETACGRNPLKEVTSWVSFYASYRSRFFVGTRRAEAHERARLSHHFRYQRQLAGERPSSKTRAVMRLGAAGATLCGELAAALARSSRPVRRREKASKRATGPLGPTAGPVTDGREA